tara:strand:- start:189 stop:695 length:507 start_codon:yes stop_codon:yes gene_type:complete
MGWNPFKWFNNRSQGGMSDGDREEFYDTNPGGVVTWDSDSDTDTTYDTWKDYDEGNPSGSYSYGGGKSQWGNIFNALEKSNSWKNRKEDTPGYLQRGPRLSAGGGATKLSSGKHMIQPFGPASGWGNYQMYHHPQKQGGGFLGTAMKIGSFFAPPGVREGLQIGSQLV